MLESDCGLQQAETKLQPPYPASIQPFCCGLVWYPWDYRYGSALIWGVGLEPQRSRNRRVSAHWYHISSGITQPSHLPPPPQPQPGGLWRGNILGLDRLSRLSHSYTSAPTEPSHYDFASTFIEKTEAIKERRLSTLNSFSPYNLFLTKNILTSFFITTVGEISLYWKNQKPILPLVHWIPASPV